MRKSAISALAGAFFLAACAATTTAPPRQAGVPGPQKVSAQRPKPKKPGCDPKEISSGGGLGQNVLVDEFFDALFGCNE